MGLLDDIDLIASSQDRPASSRLSSKRSLSEVDRSRQASPLNQSQGYEIWSLIDLQTEAKKYGFRPTKDRKTLIQQLQRVQEALKRKEEVEDADISMISSSSSFLMASSPGRSSDVEEVSMSDLTMDIIRQAKGTPNNTRGGSPDTASAADGDEDFQPIGEEVSSDDDSNQSEMALADLAAAQDSRSMDDIAPSTSDQLYKAITSDKSLYHRILLFEPVSFDEVSSTAKRAGVTGLRSKETLRNWLDMQGICFYSADLTGSRQRY